MRRWAPWVVLVLAAGLVAALLAGTRSGERLAPDNPGREGGQALARVLQSQGVTVRTVLGTAALPEQVAPGTTVLVTGTAYLTPEAGAQLLDRTREADRLVVLVPGPQEDLGTALGLDVRTTWPTGARLTGACADPRVRDGDEVVAWDVQLDSTATSGAVACFPPSPGHNVGGARAGALLTFPATTDHAEVSLVGFSSALTNGRVTEAAHAALGLRLLGASPELLWVTPQPGDAGQGAPQGLWDVLPRSATPAVVLLGAAVLALALWQGRRLGPVVVEPLPAVVHAAQTTRSRGRLYRQAGDRPHALAALQAGARHRAAARLGLSPAADPGALVDAVATATGRPRDQASRLLTDPSATDDTDFVTTARELRSLEEGLHR
ncbi:DUF4350 domain-containing protein [Ornithinimicrobium tianjinense]|uniref:DUF4350 domain-containing protein n=1 Tax=Ornithinimicrobium tianjinense TaxID=1195761 RepID=A0A917BNY7_9MICO|nr:DUF4350 domain-containing protein [Ornithinimicrobium tianjinense]GGF51359.1 hypothetical protein GCM10011366_19020 [Ornithinimicrobium tianjinense]